MALADNALTLVATVETELGLTAGAQDALLERYINQASDLCESYAGKSVYRDTAIVEKVVGDEGPYLFLAKPPINSITSISYSSSNLGTSEYEIHEPAKNGIVYAVSGSWYRSGIHFGDISHTRASGYARKVYTVNYDGGYYTPKQEDDGDGTRNLPYDIEYACLMITSYLYRSKGKDPSIASESLLGSSVSYNTSVSSSVLSILPAAAGILNQYKTVIMR